jgi:hypothetical protein
MADIKIILKRFIYRINKLCDFIKLGWNDYDWDYQFMLDILEYKFKKMENQFKYHGVAEDSNKSEQICRVLHKSLSKYQNDNYINKYKEKYLPFDVTFKITRNEDDSVIKLVTIRSDTLEELTEDETVLYHKVFRRGYKYEKRMKKKYKKIFFKTMYKHLEKLWD